MLNREAATRAQVVQLMKAGGYWGRLMDGPPELERVKAFLLTLAGQQPELPPFGSGPTPLGSRSWRRRLLSFERRRSAQPILSSATMTTPKRSRGRSTRCSTWGRPRHSRSSVHRRARY